ncbi:MAG: DUF1800 domain-containing protein [Pseudomonadota bacterium]
MDDAQILTVRFGYGAGGAAEIGSTRQMLTALRGRDKVALDYPVASMDDILALSKRFREARSARRNGGSGAERAYRRVLTETRTRFGTGIQHGIARILDTDDPFRERLTAFWADHFTVVPKNAPMRALAPTYIDTAIRPHVAGRFGDMLKAVVTHPMMLLYLDQTASIGPNSRAGQRLDRGLNENLAREILELHTLGVGGPYGQADVRELAELLTGLSVSPDEGFVFRPRIAEPGAETVLGKRYGGQRASLDAIFQAINDLATHPKTALHISGKIARHFVSDTPDQTLIDEMAQAWTRSSGDLAQVYAALLKHPSALSPPGAKVRQPMDFMVAAAKALSVTGREVANASLRDLRRHVAGPLAAMGQPVFGASGPDGWPEEAAHWITPQGLASRIAWAAAAAESRADAIGDPRAFVETVLGPRVTPGLRIAVSGAETKAEGIALTLASAEFNRR